MARGMGGDSKSYAAAEVELIAAANTKLGARMKPQKLALSDGAATVQVDGIDTAHDPPVIAEAFAGQGEVKAGQNRKLATDILKLVLLLSDRAEGYEAYLVHANPLVAKHLARASWLKAAMERFNIKELQVELSVATNAAIKSAHHAESRFRGGRPVDELGPSA